MQLNRRRPFALLPLVAAVLLAGLAVTAQAPTGRDTSAASVASFALSDRMPVDPEVAMGTLPNGFRYYVRANDKPDHRAELRLVVRAGSSLEDDDQQGLAHFVEHMEFEGTQHFPGQSVQSFLSSLGMSIGPDANAETSYDETQYRLRVPTDVPGVLDRALLVLEDWAHAATFDPDGIERERGIVLAEWRMRLGAGERTIDRINKAQLEGSRYADRPPIGKPEIIQTASRDALMRFYRDWYRPDLMAVIVVGDFDRDAVVDLVKAHFSPLTVSLSERERPAYDVPDHADPRYAIITDRETPRTVVEISTLVPARNQASVGGYRAIMLDQLFAGMFNARLDELTQSPSAPFIQAAAGRSLFSTPRTKEEVAVQAIVSNDGVTRGLASLATEMERVSRFGFTASELAREKQSMMAAYERLVTESPDRDSSSRADEYTRNFLEDEALPTIWQELAFHHRFLPEVTLRDVNALAAQWFPDRNRLIVVSAPETAGVAPPEPARIAAAISEALAKPITAYVDTVGAQPLLDKAPTPGSIARTVARADAGITEWTLSNGARVVLKPTTLKQDEVLVRAIAPGGTSVSDDASFASARAADIVIPAGGVGSFSAVALDKVLAGRAAAVVPFIDNYSEGLNGQSTPADLETLFQLIYLRFTAPRADPTAFGVLTSQFKSLLANQSASPDIVFNQTIDAALTQNHPRLQPDTPQSIDQWSLAKSMAFYKARFGNASNFTFIFTGSFTTDAIKPLVERYLATLPATNARETWRDVGIRTPAGVVERTVEKGITQKSQVAIVYNGPFQDGDDRRLALRAMTLVLGSRLNDTIREELGGTYNISAVGRAGRLPEPAYTVRIEWTCDPARTTDLVQRVFREVEYVRGNVLRPEQVRLVRAALMRQFEADSQDNSWILNELTARYSTGSGADAAAIWHQPDRIGALTAEQIQDAARTYLNPNRYVIVTLMPEKK